MFPAMKSDANTRMDDSLIALRRILRATELYARDLAHAVGLTPAQLRVLQIVDERDSVTPKALATQMGVSQATVSALVDKLVAQTLDNSTKSHHLLLHRLRCERCSQMRMGGHPRLVQHGAQHPQLCRWTPLATPL